MFKAFIDKIRGRKKTLEEFVDFSQIVELLEKLDNNALINVHYLRDQVVTFENEEPIGSVGGYQTINKGEFKLENVLNAIKNHLKPYSEKYWRGKHEVYVRKSLEEHYINFKTITIKDSFSDSRYVHKVFLNFKFSN